MGTIVLLIIDETERVVALHYISQSFEFIIRDDLNSMNNNVESLFIEIVIPGSKT